MPAASSFTRLAGALLLLATGPVGAQVAQGEYSRTPAQSAPRFKLASVPESRTVAVHYAEVPLGRLLKLQRDQAGPTPKAVQVGLAREAATEASRPALPPLRWMAVKGGAVARVKVRSEDALALRVGLRLDRLDDRVELRFSGSDAPARVVAMLTGAQAKHLADAHGIFWTPSTDGDTQWIEVFRPWGVAAEAVRVQAPRISHLLANSRNDFTIIEKIGESGSCNVDTACRVPTLGQAFVNAKNAVAHMQFVSGGNTYICSGTLLADTTGATQVPYFWSAHHCFAGNNATQTQMAQTAATLNTFWNYEATSCGSGVSTSRVQLAGGSTLLFNDAVTDAMLLRLNEPAPAGAYFAGWNAGPLGDVSVLAIHHPRGDAKKASLGQTLGRSASQTTAAWTSGTTEGGSSGSGLFTLGREGYELRGGLYGGSASCANTGSTANTQNRDYYSRLDVVFPSIAGYLATDAVPMNGSAPRLPPDTAPAAAPAAARSVPAPLPRRQPPVRERDLRR